VARRHDRLVGEEPLEILAAGPGQDPFPVAVTMRTPGLEHELAVGFLVTEGIAPTADVIGWDHGDPVEMAHPDNRVVVRLRVALDPTAIPGRAFVATASCGICGKATLDDIAVRCPTLPRGPTVRRDVLLGLHDRMRDAQAVFERTGGLHAAALFRPDGALVALREDVGRHNALDKLVGAMGLSGALPLHDRLLLVSGRVSFEIAQKAAVAGVPIVAAVSAPSDLAVATARRLGMTLIGFLRGDGFNVYAGAERVDLGG
jgi:FdhD protein